MIERDHIGIFGKMNAGKSTLMNLLTQQETSIVDPTPGTTADAKIALCEIHGIGPVKLFDTAGLDEMSGLGEKKRKKTLDVLKECDLILLMIDPRQSNVEPERELLGAARDMDKQVFVLLNLFEGADAGSMERIHSRINLLKFYTPFCIRAKDPMERTMLLDFILAEYRPKRIAMDLLPFVERDETYILVIPMDAETPQSRFLRPQQMAVEHITRKFACPSCFRLDLGKARDPEQTETEKKRFLAYLENFRRLPKGLVTDSQAMDIIAEWCPEDIPLTTFSITMIQYISRGGLADFVDGIRQLETLRTGDRVLIVEACNHSRIGEDIGTVQIPNYFAKYFPGIRLEHNFGREFQENETLGEYKLIIHCGGCMITPQKMGARIRDLKALGIPYTNYGVFLSYIQGPRALERALRPWELCPESNPEAAAVGVRG